MIVVIEFSEAEIASPDLPDDAFSSREAGSDVPFSSP